MLIYCLCFLSLSWKALRLDNFHLLRFQPQHLLLKRYHGDSKQPPAHIRADDDIYGSHAIYRQEVVDELTQYAENHSLQELDAAVTSAIEASNDSELEADWHEIKGIINSKRI